MLACNTESKADDRFCSAGNQLNKDCRKESRFKQIETLIVCNVNTQKIEIIAF